MILSNALARRLFLHKHALSERPSGAATGQALSDLIERIGFVQVDSINTVERAHHMILWSRRQDYRPDGIKPLLEVDRTLWEHWTHDASILPISTFPYWKHRFSRDTDRLRENWRSWFRDGYEQQFDTILRRVSDHGPLTSSDVGQDEAGGKGGWWDWKPSKTALEWLWRTGQLAIAGREGFQKVYDLTERVIPQEHLEPEIAWDAKIEWACASALDRLGLATVPELRAFWNAVPLVDVRDWMRRALADGRVVELEVEGADKSVKRVFAWPDVVHKAQDAPEPALRVRVLSPFDPALRDRARAEFLFGFFYRIEVFVPEPKRRWGYYVFPLLEGDRLIGRLDAKAHKAEGILKVRAFWPEAGILLTKARQARLEAELARLARFSGCAEVAYLPGWQRDHLPAPSG